MEQALKRLHPYTIGHMGDLNEWYYDWDDWDFQHRHQSHLIGLYPGNHLTDLTLQKAAIRSLEIKGDDRLEYGLAHQPLGTIEEWGEGLSDIPQTVDCRRTREKQHA